MYIYIYQYIYVCSSVSNMQLFYGLLNNCKAFKTVFETPPFAEDTAMMRLVCFSPGHPWFLRAKPQMIQYKAVSIYIFALMQ